MSTPSQQPPVYPPPGNPDAQPTAPLDPVPGRYPPPGQVPAATYVADPRPAAYRYESLRTALLLVGLLAVIAIGVAVWALLRADRRPAAGAPANSAAVANLISRVNGLESTVRGLGAAGGGKSTETRALLARITSLQQAQGKLASEQSKLAGQVSHAGGSTAQVTQLAGKEAALSAKVSQLVGKEAALSGQVSGLQGRVASLAGKVAQLQGSTNTQTTPSGTTTTG